MNNVAVVLKEKWYLVVGAIVGIWLLFKLLGSSASDSGATATVPAGVAVQYAGTNANDAAVQMAQLQAQSTLANQQIAMGQAVTLGQMALESSKSTNEANVSIADLTGRYTLAITNNNNEAAMHASDNQTTLGIVQSNNAASLGIVQSNNYTTLGIVQSNNNTSLGIVQANDAYLLGLDTNATNLKAVENSNATQLAAYGIQGQVAQSQINALQSIAVTMSNNDAAVQSQAVQSAAQLEAQRLANQGQIVQDTYALVSSGQLNKGGAGGTNQLAAWNAVINPASAGSNVAAAGDVAKVQATQLASVITAIGGAVKNGLSAVVA